MGPHYHGAQLRMCTLAFRNYSLESKYEDTYHRSRQSFDLKIQLVMALVLAGHAYKAAAAGGGLAHAVPALLLAVWRVPTLVLPALLLPGPGFARWRVPCGAAFRLGRAAVFVVCGLGLVGPPRLGCGAMLRGFADAYVGAAFTLATHPLPFKHHLPLHTIHTAAALAAWVGRRRGMCAMLEDEEGAAAAAAAAAAAVPSQGRSWSWCAAGAAANVAAAAAAVSPLGAIPNAAGDAAAAAAVVASSSGANSSCCQLWRHIEWFAGVARTYVGLWIGERPPPPRDACRATAVFMIVGVSWIVPSAVMYALEWRSRMQFAKLHSSSSSSSGSSSGGGNSGSTVDPSSPSANAAPLAASTVRPSAAGMPSSSAAASCVPGPAAAAAAGPGAAEGAAVTSTADASSSGGSSSSGGGGGGSVCNHRHCYYDGDEVAFRAMSMAAAVLLSGALALLWTACAQLF